MKKTRIFALILCAMLLLSAVSCSGTGKTDVTTPAPDTTAEETPVTGSGDATDDITSGTVSDPADETTSSEPQPDETTSEETTAEETTAEETSATGTPDETTSSTEPASSMKPAIWTLTGPNGNTVTLVGTMHVLKVSDFPIPDVLEERLKNSWYLAVECDTQAAASDIN